MTLFASPAATLLSHIQTAETAERISETLQSALYSRDLVNRACGILMERHRLTPEQALRRLMRQARETRQTLPDVSAQLVAGSSADPA
jgi:AmiR/NasT family two-component response regulator